MVHSGLRWRMRAGFDLWIPSGRVAFWGGGSRVVDCGAEALVAGKIGSVKRSAILPASNFEIIVNNAGNLG